MTKKELIKKIVYLSGSKMMFLYAVTVPLGLLQGLSEIMFGFALLNFLRYFHLVDAQHIPLEFILDRWSPIYLLLIMGFLRTAIASMSLIVSNITYEGFNVALRKKLAAQLLGHPETLRLSVADTSNIMSNLMPRSATYINNLSIFTIQAVMMAITLAGLLKLSLSLTLIACASLIAFGLPVLLTRRLFQQYSAVIYANSKYFSDKLLRAIRNLEFLRIIDKTKDEAEGLVRINRIILKNYLRYIVFITTNSMWPQFSAVCIVTFIVLINTRHAWVASAVLIPFVYLLSQITASVGEIIRAVGNLQFNKPFLVGLISLLPEENRIELVSKTHTVSPSIVSQFHVKDLVVDNLAIGRADHVYLNGISFKCGTGDFVCFQGESGKGKTTLLMTLIGLLPQKAGKILWNGSSVESLTANWFKGRIAYSGADPFLLDTTIRNNVLLGNEHLHCSDDEIWNIFELTKCSFAKNLTGGLDYRLKEGGEGISAGQKQRLSLARALLRKPEILLLDEATANIDIETEEAIISNIKKHNPLALILAVSHRESMLKFATLCMAF